LLAERGTSSDLLNGLVHLVDEPGVLLEFVPVGIQLLAR
jgi:hypothetical protein